MRYAEKVESTKDHLLCVMELASTSPDRIRLGETAGIGLLRESGAVRLGFLRQACEAVASHHAHDIVHRDLKPCNILLMLDAPDPMRAVIADLGIASSVKDQGKLTAGLLALWASGLRPRKWPLYDPGPARRIGRRVHPRYLVGGHTGRQGPESTLSRCGCRSGGCRSRRARPPCARRGRARPPSFRSSRCFVRSGRAPGSAGAGDGPPGAGGE